MSEPPKENSILEKAPSPEVLQTVQELVGEVQEIIVESHGLQEFPLGRAAGLIWKGTGLQLGEKLGRRILEDAGIYTFERDNELFPVIYFSSQSMEKLANSAPESRLRGNCLPNMIGVIEETSHYVYEEFYRRKFPGQQAHGANDELIAVIDKYNVLQALFLKNFKRLMTPKEHDRAIYEIVLAQEQKSWPGNRPAEYIIGHELGKQYIHYLYRLYSLGRNPSNELRIFYQASNKEQMRHLLYDLHFKIHTNTPQEEIDVQKVFKKLDVLIFKASPTEQPQTIPPKAR